VHSTKTAEHYARQIFRKFGQPEISPRHRIRQCRILCAWLSAGSDEPKEHESPASVKQTIDQRQQQNQRKKRSADSTDFFATTMTRRFGLAGGLAWVGFLTFGVVSEQAGHDSMFASLC